MVSYIGQYLYPHIYRVFYGVNLYECPLTYSRHSWKPEIKGSSVSDYPPVVEQKFESLQPHFHLLDGPGIVSEK